MSEPDVPPPDEEDDAARVRAPVSPVDPEPDPEPESGPVLDEPDRTPTFGGGSGSGSTEMANEGPPPDSEAEPPGVPAARLTSILESLLFVADQPLSVAQLAALVQEPDAHKVEGALAVLGAEWSTRGIQLHAIAGGWQFRTHPQNAVWVQRLVAQKPVRLTRSQLETLAICAYRQPITRPEIDDIRGVDSGGTLRTLLDRSLVRILGKKEEPGRPLLYGTTREFLQFFNLGDLRELPTLREFHELSDEHRAQVEALERAAPPGSVEPGPGAPGAGGGQGSFGGMAPLPPPPPPPPLQRVELSDAPLDEDLEQIDKLIEEAGTRARSAAEALGTALPESVASDTRSDGTRPADGAAARRPDGTDPHERQED